MTLRIPINKPILLPAVGTWTPACHIFDEESAYAIEAALAAGRPLLVRGEPGTGKSQLARAAAEVLTRVLVAEVVHARSESHDLLYHFDAVGRLGEAQALDRGCSAKDRAKLLNPRRFISPGPLWWVFDWGSAERQYSGCLHRPARPLEAGKGKGCVLLIDEIDKADADLPNGLLETLGNGAFPVPYLAQQVGLTEAARNNPPLVIITTNEERELPPAFVRRCLVLRMTLPEAPLLKRRAAEQPDICCDDKVMERVLEQLFRDREAAATEGVTPPGQAEFFDILRALTRMTEGQSGAPRIEEQVRLFGRVQHFFLEKGRGGG